MKKSTIALLVAGAVGVGVLAILGLISGLIWLSERGGMFSSKPSSDADRKLVVEAAALVAYGAEVDPKCGTYKTTRSFNLTTYIEYQCDADSLSVLSSAEIRPTLHDARQRFLVNIGGFKAGVALGSDATLERRDDLLGTLGDQRYAATILSGGKAAGNVFVVRQGKIVHSLILTGLYFDDPDTAQALLAPVVEAGKKQK